jgi:peptidoglycan/xylan/chitin deacetylase (PgdA/CDA1 family)
MYFITVPRWLRWVYSGLIWNIPVEDDEKILYLTFDDGPHPIATPFVLDQLKKYNAKATFFCIGRNVVEHPGIYKQILDEGHAVGNHTYNHLNGWKVKDKDYIDDILEAGEVIDSKMFRPPYGRITKFQSKVLRGEHSTDPRTTISQYRFSIVMWSVLSADWDNNIDGEKCYENVILNAKPGSIIVFHDSTKALERMQFALPKVLEYYAGKGFQFMAIRNKTLV